MSDELYKILYCSRNLIEGTQENRDAEISQILSTARAKNEPQGVTGALLFSEGCFAQVLEGPRLAIESTFERIQRDPRHSDVTILESGKAQTRDFPDWSMAHVKTQNQADSARLLEATYGSRASTSGAADEVLDLLRTLVIEQE